MNVAACDFDGTLMKDNQISSDDLLAIEAWRSAGNAFGIVTGRGLSMLLAAMNRCAKVSCDFLICNNGALICDGSAKELYHSPLTPAAQSCILSHLAVQSCEQCVFFSGVSAFVHADKKPYWIRPENVLPPLDSQAAPQLPLHQISLAYPDRTTGNRWAKAIASSCEDVEVHFSTLCIDITARGVNKTEGIRHLLRTRHWSSHPLVIGDDGNDLSMIRDFSGYAVSSATNDVLDAAAQVFSSVGDMLRFHMSGSQ